MTAHIFVDESKKGGLVLVAAIVQADDLHVSRKAMDSLLLRNQRRIHFKDENAGRKKQILTVIEAACVTARVYVGPRHVPELEARRVCLDRLVRDLVQLGAARLVLELDSSLVEHDRRWLYSATRSARAEFEYHHLRAHEECLLWAADAIAWCWAAKGHWRARIRRLVVAEIDGL